MVVPEHRAAGYVDGTDPGVASSVSFGIYPPFTDVLADPASDCTRHRIVNGAADFQTDDRRTVIVCTVQRDAPAYHGEIATTPPAGTTDLALGAKASAGGGTVLTPASLATDGRADGYAERNAMTMIADGWQPWIDVDLGSVRNVDALLIWPRTDPCCATALRNVLILTSSDPIPTTDPTAARAGPGVQSRYVEGILGNPTRVDLDAPVRYIRVQTVDATSLAVAEIQAWGLRDANTPDRQAPPKKRPPQASPRR
jgi:hypothetical protein